MKKDALTIGLLVVALFSFCFPVLAVEYKKSDDIVLVFITDATLKRIGSFPLSRVHYANFIDSLYKYYQPKCVYIDIQIDTPSKEMPAGDLALANSVKGKQNLFFMASTGDEKPANLNAYTGSVIASGVQQNALTAAGANMPLPSIALNGAVPAFSSIIADPDGYYSKFPTFIRINSSVFLSTPLAIASRYLSLPTAKLSTKDEVLYIGKTKCYVDPLGQFTVNFEHTFASCTYDDIVLNKTKKNAIDGKIVVLGCLFTGADDFLPTPVNTRLQGTEFAAHATQTLIDTYRAK